MILQPDVNHPENVDLEPTDSEIEKFIETNSPCQEEIMQQNYNRPTDKYYRNSMAL